MSDVNAILWAIYDRSNAALILSVEHECMFEMLIAASYYFDSTLDAIRGDDSL